VGLAPALFYVIVKFLEFAAGALAMEMPIAVLFDVRLMSVLLMRWPRRHAVAR